MRRLGIPVLAVLGFFLAACGSSSDEAEAIHGTWSIASPPGAFESFEPDGTFSVYYEGEPPLEWGTFTLEDGTLTMTSADDSYCGPDGLIVWEVTFSEDGKKLQEKLISESCANETHLFPDRVLTRYTP